MGKTRLGCLFCDRDDFDGIAEIPADWYAVDRVQSYEDSYAEEIDQRGSPFDWQTHIGVCPECEVSRCHVIPTSLMRLGNC